MKIYTRRGDDGTTGLFGGPRVGKDALRVAAYGDVDELNSWLGIVRCDVATDPELEAIVGRIQSELFTLGAQLATPDAEAAPRDVPVVQESHVTQMEREIDRFDAELVPLRSFVLPAGSRAAASLHVARTICRRAERIVVALRREESVPEMAVHYLNRLSDLLFTMARVANHRAKVPEVKWVPPA